MKKSKILLLLAVLFVSAFLVVGKANAESQYAWAIKSSGVYCDPEALEPGQSGKCYYAGHSNMGTDTTQRNAGFYAQIYTTDHLTIKGVEHNKSMSNVNAKFFTSSSSSETITTSTDMPASLNNFKCGKITDVANSQGCGIWYTTKGNTEAFVGTTDAMPLYASGAEWSNFGFVSPDKAVVLGAVLVELDKDNNIDTCGNLCIATFGVATNDDWDYADCINDSMTSSISGQSCSGHNVVGRSDVTHGSSDKFDCFELHIKSVVPQNTETGAFVSYAVLAAAALIAISAVTIAKKHNKLQKI